jgi:putative endonuclease
MKQSFVYITANPGRTTLYVGVTNNLTRRLAEHRSNKGKPETFAGRYFCYNLVYYETFADIGAAIRRQKEIKLMNRKAKEDLIKTSNPRLSTIVIE